MSLINSWSKRTDFKLFGLLIFSREEFFDGQLRNPDYDIILTPDYYKEEFKTRNGGQ